MSLGTPQCKKTIVCKNSSLQKTGLCEKTQFAKDEVCKKRSLLIPWFAETKALLQE